MKLEINERRAIKTWMETKGLSLQAAGDLIGVSDSAVMNWLRGGGVRPFQRVKLLGHIQPYIAAQKTALELDAHPIQPLILDENGVLRFKPNQIVRFLLDGQPIDLNRVMNANFSADDRSQLVQLLGIPVSSYADFPCAKAGVVDAAKAAYKLDGASQRRADDAKDEEIRQLKEQIKTLKSLLRPLCSTTFNIPPEDLP